MPCYDPDSNKTIVYTQGIDPDLLRCEKEETRKAVDYAMFFQAALCALLNELERRGIAEAVLAEASRYGLIDLMSFWKEHKKNDKARLAKEIHRYSKDEQAIIFDLLKASS